MDLMKAMYEKGDDKMNRLIWESMVSVVVVVVVVVMVLAICY